MDYWYSAQLRQYRLQIIRAFSNFQVQTGQGGPNNTAEIIRVPCRYGDPSRVAELIVRGNSENKVLSVPFITCTINSLNMAPERRQDPSLIQPAYVNERVYDTESQRYTNQIGNRYTVDRYMPVPYNLGIQVDIWTNNLNMKEQLLEQILVLYNPAIDIQTSVNPVDWTVLSYIEMQDAPIWSSRSIPIGTENPIDVATINFKVPIWISPPAKVKKQTLIHQIVTNIVQGYKDPDSVEWTEYEFMARTTTTPGDAVIKVKHLDGYNYQVALCNADGSTTDKDSNPTITKSKINPTIHPGIKFKWNNITCSINSSTLTGAVADIKASLSGSKLNCLLFDNNCIQFLNMEAGNNTFEDITPGSLEKLGLIATTYPGGNLAWWRLLELYGNLKSYLSYGTNASQLRLKTVNDIENINTDIIGWIDLDPIDQNKIILHIDPESLPLVTLPPINAIVNPLESGPGVNLPSSSIGQRYLLVEKPAEESVAWGVINANENDIVEFNGSQWISAWTPTSAINAVEYVKNNRSSKIFRYQNNEWEDLIYPKYMPGYWRISL